MWQDKGQIQAEGVMLRIHVSKCGIARLWSVGWMAATTLPVGPCWATVDTVISILRSLLRSLRDLTQVPQNYSVQASFVRSTRHMLIDQEVGLRRNVS